MFYPIFPATLRGGRIFGIPLLLVGYLVMAPVLTTMFLLMIAIIFKFGAVVTILFIVTSVLVVGGGQVYFVYSAYGRDPDWFNSFFARLNFIGRIPSLGAYDRRSLTP